jgi:acetone carboxylase gamma subunit
LKNEAPISKCEPDYLAFKTNKFVLREYYCPKCGVMFEVDMVEKSEPQIHSVQLNE